jgi:hypothetical protein
LRSRAKDFVKVIVQQPVLRIESLSHIGEDLQPLAASKIEPAAPSDASRLSLASRLA